MKNLFLSKMSWFYSGEKEKNVFQLFDDLGEDGVAVGRGKKKRVFLHRSVLFIARGKRSLWGFSQSLQGNLLSFYFFFPANGWQKHSVAHSLICFLSFCHMNEQQMGGRDGAAHWYVPSSFTFLQVPVQLHPSILLTSSVSTLHSFIFVDDLCFREQKHPTF